jgi:high-affinity iron transporter
MLRRILFCFIALIINTTVFADSSPSSLSTIIQLANYVGADYNAAVANGAVINNAEYKEMTEFSAQIKSLLSQLPSNDPETTKALLALSDKLIDEVQRKEPQERVYDTSQALSKLLMQSYNIKANPPALPERSKVAQLFQTNCSSCHGASGQGDGLLAANLEPKPTNFTDRSHMDQLSTFALYNTINLGVADTAMASFESTLSDADRWGLAFYISSMGVSPVAIEEGKKLWETSPTLRANFSTDQIATLSPSELFKKYSMELAPVIYFLYENPQLLQKQNQDLWQITLANLQESFQSYQEGNYTQAYDLAIRAYLEGFEGLEPTIDVVDRGLRENLEAQMLSYRQLISQKAPFEKVQTVFGQLVKDIEAAQQKLAESQMTWFKIFLSALIILLREGLEIILVVALVAAMLVKAGRRDALIYVHLGWITALIAGIGTWFVSHYFLSISGMQRELTEGLTALLAAAILFWVGFWLHSNNIAGEWQRFIKERLGSSLSRGSLLGLSSLCFIAVYREMFETILFYETLWLQVDGAAGQSAIYYGFGVAVAILLCLVFLIFRVGVKLPINVFFTWSSRLIFALALIFIGQGIHALEEAGKLPEWSFDFMPTISLIGIYPSVIGLSLQVILLVGTIVLLKKKKQ